MTVGALIQQPVQVARDPETGGLGRLRGYARVLRAEGLDPAQFDDFVQLAKAEAKRGPREPLAELIDELLADPRLHGLVIDGHLRVRSKLLEVQQELGFPWALQIAPEDLALLSPPNEHVGFRTATFLVALVAAGLDGCLGVAAAHEARLWPFFLVGAAHAVITMFAAFIFDSKKLLRVLGWMWLCGPAFTWWLMETSTDFDRVLILPAGLIVAFPSMLTAWLALGLSGKAPE